MASKPSPSAKARTPGAPATPPAPAPSSASSAKEPSRSAQKRKRKAADKAASQIERDFVAQVAEAAAEEEDESPASTPAKKSKKGRASASEMMQRDAHSEGERADSPHPTDTPPPTWTEAYTTETLWAWAHDYPANGLQPGDIVNRERVLAALARVSADAPGSAQEAEDNWRHHLGPDDDDAEAEEGDVEAEEEEEQCAQAAPPAFTPLLAPLPRNSVRIPQRTRPPPHMVAAAAPQALQWRDCCPHCFHQQEFLATANRRCASATCGLLVDVALSDERNAYLREQARAGSAPTGTSSSSSASSVAGQSHADIARSTLTKRDKEFERLAAEGPQLARFALKAPLTAKAALDAVRDSFGAMDFAVPSESLLRLVRSGRLADVGHALPRPIAAASQADYADTVITITGGKAEQA